MSSNLNCKVKKIQGKILTLLNEKEKLMQTNIMYGNCISQIEEKILDLKELEKFKYFDGLNIKSSIVFFNILKILICICFVLEFQFILFSFGSLFSLPVLKTGVCNLVFLFLFYFSNKNLKSLKKIKDISLNFFGDTIYDFERIKERKKFFHLEKRRLFRKRIELEKETLQNDKEVEDLKNLLRDVASACSDNKCSSSFIDSTHYNGNFIQQFMLSKRR